MHLFFQTTQKKLKTMTLRMNNGDVFQLISLPDTVFEQTLGFLSFHEISILRRVSKKFNETCMRLLNQGFRSAEKFHGKCLKVTNLISANLYLMLFLLYLLKGCEGQTAKERIRAKKSQTVATL